MFAPAADGEWTSLLQEDDGLTLAALEGACRRTTFTLARAGGELTLRAEVAGDGYPEFAREAFELVFHGDGDAVERCERARAGTRGRGATAALRATERRHGVPARWRAARLSGPAGAAGWLPDGGVLVFDDGHHAVLPAPDTLDAWGETTMAA